MTKSCAAQAVWFSASADLAVDATRDFRDIGAYKYDPIRIHDLRKVGKPPAGQKLEDIKVSSWRSIPKSPLIHLFIVLWPKKIAINRHNRHKDFPQPPAMRQSRPSAGEDSGGGGALFGFPVR
jgi:hypothetical protein